MASVAADTSAIAPPPPLPSRSEATPPAGPGGAFSDLLDAAAAPPPAPQPQGAAGARTDDGSSAAHASATGASGANPAASSGPSNGKAPGGSKSTDDAHDGSADRASAAVNVTVVAGLALPPFAFAPMPATDQTSAASQDTPTASSDSAASTSDDTSGPPADRKDAGVSSDPTATGLLAAIPGLVTVIAVATPASSAQPQTGPVTPLPPAATVPGGISTGPSTSAPAAGSDEAKVAAPAAQQTDGTRQQNQAASSAALDLLTTLPSPASALPTTDGLQTAALPASAPAAAGSAASDQNPHSAPVAPPIITSDAPSGTIKPAAAAALNPPAVLISGAAEVPAETVGNASPPREAEAVQIALPAQVAIRFAATAHSGDDATSDNGTDVLGGASIGATPTAGGSISPGAALAPSFTGILSTMQMAPGTVAAPQHATVAADAVPLAAVPIAIVTRAEAGERKFEIRLDPPDLGRIEVQLNVDSSGRATSHLIVDRADTLDLLRRDAPVLERALQSAGLTTDNGSLQFSLRDQSFAGRDQGSPTPLAPPTPATALDSDVAPLDAAVRRYGVSAGLGGGIDIRV